jgi:hypothetical protein
LEGQDADPRLQLRAERYAEVSVEAVREAEWDTPGDIAPPGALAYFVSVRCSNSGEGDIHDYVAANKDGPRPQLAIVPATGSPPLCRFGGSQDESEKVDYNVQYCERTTVQANALESATSTLRRANASSEPPNDPSVGYSADDGAAPCTASLKRVDADLAYKYDCNGMSASYLFEKASP